MLKEDTKKKENNSQLLKENLEKIQGISAFTDNWNGNGAKPFTKEEINLFRTILMTLHEQPEISPTGRNSLYMQYKGSDGSTLGFEIASDSITEVYVSSGGSPGIMAKILTKDEINTEVERFCQ